MEKNNLRITVFGGSCPKPGEQAYEEAYRLGELIGGAGFTVITGGYMGTMEAVSRGAAEKGGKVIGVTCDQIEVWRQVLPNSWVQEEQRYITQKDRLYALIENCDAALVLPGGIGTLAELAIMWSLLQTGAIPKRQLILVGAVWQKMIQNLFEQLGEYIPETSRDLISFAADVNEAFQLLKIESGSE
ncbi:MAG: LOG family protein [Chloroflexota bacterium]|nr:MAG: LOG family protein [Chloroflexota bacterium]